MSEINCFDDIFGDYVPLERPKTTVTAHVANPVKNDIDNHTDSEDYESSSSDDDNPLSKLNKVKTEHGRKRKFASVSKTPPVSVTKSKYKGWFGRIDDDVADDLIRCNIDTDRYVEAYNYKLSHAALNTNSLSNISYTKNETSNESMKSLPLKHRKKCFKKFEEKILPELGDGYEHVNVMKHVSSDLEFSLNIAKCLNEPNIELISRVVQTIGRDKVIEIYNKTRNKESNGGMLTSDKHRRRTSGGIFLTLVKTSNNITQSQRSYIFGEKSNGEYFKEKRKARRRKRQRRLAEKTAQCDSNNPSPSIIETENKSIIEPIENMSLNSAEIPPNEDTFSDPLYNDDKKAVTLKDPVDSDSEGKLIISDMVCSE